jgi:DNA-binding ferritin-like protein
MGPCEKATSDYEERKRMRKLAGIQEEKKEIDPEFKEKVDQLAKNIKYIADEIRKRNK